MKTRTRRSKQQQPGHPPGRGLAVDAGGGPVVDPTQNVKDLSEAANQRQDDLRELNNKYLDARLDALEDKAILRANHQGEISALRAVHQKEMDGAEANRLNSIRQVDQTNVATAAAQALTAIQTLATNTQNSAETLRTQLANTAATIANQFQQTVADIGKRLTALEATSYEGKGKQAVADPQMEKLAALVERMAGTQQVGTGKSMGINATWIVLLGAVSLLVGLITIGTFVFIATRQPAAPTPQVIYTPAPVGTQLPTTPPNAVPR